MLTEVVLHLFTRIFAVLFLCACASHAIETRRPANDAELRFWLQNMLTHHYSPEEMTSVVGLNASEISNATQRLDARAFERKQNGPLLLLPYPGGRHPRIGFLDGAVEPQRETKFSVFLPWDAASYVVVDLPEALFSNLGLTYLAHTHIPTIWSQTNVTLPTLEWIRHPDGSLQSERVLPNGIAFGAAARPATNGATMELWLRNGSGRPLTGLRVQNCVMLKGAAGFNQQTNANKILRAPFAACGSPDRQRWIITAWEHCGRAWANPPVPCLHSDPVFPDCPPGETKRLRGQLWIYHGTGIDSELKRLETEFPGER